MIMQKYHQHFPEIDNIKWTEYFLKEFIPEYKFHDDIKKSAYNYVHYDNKNQYPGIVILSNELQKKCNFPPIEYFLIFRHIDMDQPIHADGLKVLRNASFNLPLMGYEGTSMNFYKKKNLNIEYNIRNANYYNIEDLILVDEFAGGNEWVLVDSSVPHNIVSINTETPRITICFRFTGNPTFEDLVKNAKS